MRNVKIQLDDRVVFKQHVFHRCRLRYTQQMRRVSINLENPFGRREAYYRNVSVMPRHHTQAIIIKQMSRYINPRITGLYDSPFELDLDR